MKIEVQISEQRVGYAVSADRLPGLSAWGETPEKLCWNSLRL